MRAHSWLLLPLLPLLAGKSAALTIFGSSCSTAFIEEPHAFCVFPSQGPDGNIISCQSYSKTPDAWWCPTTHNYCKDGAYKWCPNTRTTYRGSDPGQECHFPFWYNGVEYRHCLRLGTWEKFLWCSTTPGNYSGRWVRCRDLPGLMPCHFPAFAAAMPNSSRPDDIQLQCVPRNGSWTCKTGLGEERKCPDTATTEAGNDPGRSCRFPFKLSNAWYSRCIQSSINGNQATAGSEFEWCATTDSFDRDRLWTRCRKLEAPGLSGVSVLLMAAGGVVSAAFAASCVLYCCCEPTAPCRRSWRRRHQREPLPPPEPTERAAAARLAGNKASRRSSRSCRHRRRPSPTAPHLEEVDSEETEFRLPTYEEVLALSAADQVRQQQQQPPPPPPPPHAPGLSCSSAGKSEVSFDGSDRVPL